MLTGRLQSVLVVVFLTILSDAAEYTNVALGKQTKQSSTYWSKYSHYAVDGNRSPEITVSCTHTDTSDKNFWLVDLLSSFQIHSINITNRNSHESARLRDFYIYVSDVNPLPIPSTTGETVGRLCVTYPGILPPEGPHSLMCSKYTHGRYVYLWKPRNTGSLTVCEFEVLVTQANLKVQQGSFRTFLGMKSSKAPFYSKTVHNSSRSVCLSLCLKAPGGLTTVVQIDKISKKCECIEESGLITPSADVVASDWILMKSFGNL